MEKGSAKKQKEPSKKEQYQRFLETVHNLGIAEKESRERFERAFQKIVPPRRKP